MTKDEFVSKFLFLLSSRKFWFGLMLPVAVQVVALAMEVITPAQFVGALTATTSVFTGATAFEDAGRGRPAF